MDQRWKEINYDAITNFYLAMTYVILSSIAEKTIAQEI